jgi:hypothetical protein
MPINLSDVQPAATAPATAPATTPAIPAEDTGTQTPGTGSEGEIPKDVLRIPALYGLLQGKPAAIYAPKNQPDPDITTVLKHGKELISAGFRFYEAKSKPVNVLYNTLFLSPEDLEKADASGQLDKVAEPFAEVRASFDQLRTKKPPGETGSGAPPGQAATAPAGIAMGGAPVPASVQNKLATARIGALTPGNSTTGRGRILTEIQKPVV